MKRSFYPRLAIDGMRKNRRMYGPYLAMGALMAAICYILSALSRSDALRTLPGGDNLCMIMALGNVVLLIFSVIFLFYTNSFLIRRRRREFGLYNVLGMSKRNLRASSRGRRCSRRPSPSRAVCSSACCCPSSLSLPS